MTLATDYVLTIDSDYEDEDELPASKRAKTSHKPTRNEGVTLALDEATLNPEFNFDLADGGDDIMAEFDDQEEIEGAPKDLKHKRITVDDIIERRRADRKMSHSSKRKSIEVITSNSEGNGAEDVSGSETSANEDAGISESEDVESDAKEEYSGFIDDQALETDTSEDDAESLDEKDKGQARTPFRNGLNPSISSASDEDDSAASSDDESDVENEAEIEKKKAFFAPEESVSAQKEAKSFMGFNLSRPLLRAVQAMNFSTPTPIQRKAIPIALQGLDVLGSAVTGSGKTAAFLIPILERLMFKDRNGAGEIRVLILTPTRELAVQCAEVGKSLAKFMDVSFAVIVGGLSLKAQETTLRARPDIVIATPGRLIDHVHNTPSFDLSALDILVLDEADRMLSDGFADELAEVIQSCPKSRQTMLFSATMTDDVDSLVRLSMNRPVRLFVDPKKTLVKSLVQEFVRVRKESDRQAILVTLCRSTAKRSAIVFFRSKVLCHQMKVVFGLLGLRASELHGNLTQEQRLQSLRQFRDGEVDYLLATDVASRGLDIKGVETVINYDMPGQIELYLHRVGRTARASTKGRSISLVGEPDRKMLKAVMKRSDAEKVKHRVLNPENLKVMMERLDSMKREVTAVLEEESEERAIRAGEMQIQKVQNMIEHKDEILARPRREWFQTGREKDESKGVAKDQYNANFDGLEGHDGQESRKRKRETLSRHKSKRRSPQDEARPDKAHVASTSYNVRQTKKLLRRKKITHAPIERSEYSFQPKKPQHSVKQKKRPGQKSKVGASRVPGAKETASRTKVAPSAREGARSKRGDVVPLRDKKGRSKGGSKVGSKGPKHRKSRR